MKNKIEVEEYIRTKDGRIDKVDRYSIGCCVYHCKNGMCIDECETVGIPISDIKKHSSNIIDLIEEDDIIRIIDDYDDEIIIHIDSKNLHDRVKRRLESETWKLKSIVTKEQFKNIEYFF